MFFYNVNVFRHQRVLIHVMKGKLYWLIKKNQTQNVSFDWSRTMLFVHLLFRLTFLLSS